MAHEGFRNARRIAGKLTEAITLRPEPPNCSQLHNPLKIERESKRTLLSCSASRKSNDTVLIRSEGQIARRTMTLVLVCAREFTIVLSEPRM
jgi:hypothetical protein